MHEQYPKPVIPKYLYPNTCTEFPPPKKKNSIIDYCPVIHNNDEKNRQSHNKKGVGQAIITLQGMMLLIILCREWVTAVWGIYLGLVVVLKNQLTMHKLLGSTQTHRQLKITFIKLGIVCNHTWTQSGIQSECLYKLIGMGLQREYSL